MLSMSMRAAGLAGALAIAIGARQAPAQTPAADPVAADGRLPPPFATNAGPGAAPTLRAVIATSRGTAADGVTLHVRVAVEPVDPRGRFVRLSAALSAGSRPVATIVAAGAALDESPARLSLTAPPGRDVLRVVATDAAGRTATLDTTVDVGLTTAGPLRLGSLNLGVAHPGPPPAAVHGARPDAVPPDVRLQFAHETSAVAFFDLYGGAANERVSIALEVLRHPDGPPVQLLQASVEAADAGEPDHYLVTAPIDLSSLSPGDYLVRATVGVAGQPPGVISRTLRKGPEEPR